MSLLRNHLINGTAEKKSITLIQQSITRNPQEFMSGYEDGFESCGDNSLGSKDQGLSERSEDGTENINPDSARPAQQQCDPSYPDICIAPPPPDLNCNDISETNFKVLPPDPHGFDRDRDGVGCES